MTPDEHADPPPRPSPPLPPLAFPLLAWLLIQLAALAPAAARVEWTANYPRPAEALAVQVMLIAQFVAAGMLFPFLLRDVRSWAVMSATGGLMLLLAWMMTPIDGRHVALAWGHVAIWLAALAVWRAVVAPAWHLKMVPVALLLTLGGLLASYLREEFQPAASPVAFRFLPLAGLLAYLTDPTKLGPPLSSLAFLFVAGYAVLASKRRIR